MHISILPTKDALNLSRGVLLLTAAAPPDGKRSQPAREAEKARLEQSERGWRDDKERELEWEARKEGTAGLHLKIVNLKKMVGRRY